MRTRRNRRAALREARLRTLSRLRAIGVPAERDVKPTTSRELRAKLPAMPSAADHVQRGFYSALANWPLALLGIVFQFIMTMIFVVGLLSAIVPLVVIGIVNLRAPGADAEKFVERFVLDHPFAVIYVLVVIAVVLVPLMLIYSFEQAARAAVLLEAEEKHEGDDLAVGAFKVFEVGRWAAYGREHWWAVFGILNIVWSIWAGAVLLFVLGAAAVVWFTREHDAFLAVACSTLAIMFLVLTLTAIVGAVWSQLAILERVRTAATAPAATRRGWGRLKDDFGKLVTIQILLIAVAIAIGMVIVSFYVGSMLISQIPGMIIALLPLKIVISIIQSGIGAFLGSWFTASFASHIQSRERFVIS